MKDQTDQTLLVVFLMPLAGSAVNWQYGLQSGINVYLALGFHAVPVFCLQLLLCRKARRWVAAPAVGCVLAWAVYSFQRRRRRRDIPAR